MKQTLYKYMPVQSEEALERLVAILRGRIYYSSPTSFNDPFEMSAIFDAPDQDEVMELLAETQPLANLHLSKSARAKIYRQVGLRWERNASCRASGSSRSAFCAWPPRRTTC